MGVTDDVLREKGRKKKKKRKNDWRRALWVYGMFWEKQRAEKSKGKKRGKKEKKEKSKGIFLVKGERKC